MSFKRRKSVAADGSPAPPSPAVTQQTEEAPAIVRTDADDFVAERPELIDRVVLPIYLAALIAYSYGVSLATGCKAWAMLVFYAAQFTAFFAWHWQAHNKLWWVPFNRGCYEHHKIHHWVRFPPEAFFGSAAALAHYGDAAATAARMSSWAGSLPLASSPSHEALVYMLFIAILGVARFVFACSWPTLGFATFQALVVGVVGNYLHTSFHVQDHPLSRFTWWRELQVLHFTHHLGSARHNYAMVNFTLDKAFRVFFPHKAALDAAAARKRARAAGAGVSALQAAGVELPAGVSAEGLKSALRTSPLSYALLMSAGVSAPERGASSRTALSRGLSAVAVRLAAVVAGLWAFFRLQEGVIAFNTLVSGDTVGTAAAAAAFGMVDRGHDATAALHAALASSPATSATLVSVASLVTDASAAGILLVSVTGATVRPFLAALSVLALRALCVAVTHLPAPAASLWAAPAAPHLPPFLSALGLDSLPTLVSAFGPAHQQFFSGSIALAVIVAGEALAAARLRLAGTKHAQLATVAAAAAAFSFVAVQALFALATRAHWSLDVLAGALAGLYCYRASLALAPAVDAFLP